MKNIRCPTANLSGTLCGKNSIPSISFFCSGGPERTRTSDVRFRTPRQLRRFACLLELLRSVPCCCNHHLPAQSAWRLCGARPNAFFDVTVERTAWGRDDLSSTPIRPKSVPCVRPDCTCSVFSTKLRIIVHNFHASTVRSVDDGSGHLDG